MTVVSIRAGRRVSGEAPGSGGRPEPDAMAGAVRSGMAEDTDDNARFASLVLPYLPDAYSLARWLTGNRADAEDVVQDACLRAFRSIASLVGSNPRAWF